jgi:hypothetical protein
MFGWNEAIHLYNILMKSFLSDGDREKLFPIFLVWCFRYFA